MSHHYRVNDESVAALHGVDLTVEAGEFVAVVGPSGCGKTTLLRAIAGLLAHSSGDVTVLGGSSDEARRSRALGLVTQDPGLLPWLNVRDNVGLTLDVTGNKANKHDIVQELLERVGIDRFADYYPGQLSGGMRQRVALARALAHRPRLLLMDEPFGALDELAREEIRLELLRVLEQEPASVVFVTHSIREAVLLADRVAVMTGSPGGVRSVVQIELERPRLMSLEDRPEFQELVSRIRGLLSNDAASSPRSVEGGQH